MSFKNLKNNSRFIILALLASISLSVIVPLMKNQFGISHASNSTTPIISWDFSDNKDSNSWSYSPSDEVNYVSNDSKLSTDRGMLKLSVDYSNNSLENYSQTGITYSENFPLQVKGVNHASFDFIYDSTLLNGSFLAKIHSDDCKLDKLVTIDTLKAVSYAGTLKKVQVQFEFEPIANETTNNLSICIIGNKTSYKGDLRIDNIKMFAK